MVEKLNRIISNFEDDSISTSQLWSYYYVKVFNLLLKFNDNDWIKLINILPKKSNIWKRRLAYCLRDPRNQYQEKILSDLVKIDDVEIFRTIVFFADIGDFVFPENISEIILEKIDKYIPEVDLVMQDSFESYKNKILGVKKK